MTYKAAAAGLNLGGGKAVIIGDPKTQKQNLCSELFGAYVNSLHGLYITAEDVGTSVRTWNMFYGNPIYYRHSKSIWRLQRPESYTAHGVLMGIKASINTNLALTTWKGKSRRSRFRETWAVIWLAI